MQAIIGCGCLHTSRWLESSAQICSVCTQAAWYCNGPVTVSVRWTVSPAASRAGDATAWNGPLVPEAVGVGVGTLAPAPARPHATSRAAASSSGPIRFTLLGRRSSLKVPGLRGFAGGGGRLDLVIDDSTTGVDRPCGAEDDVDVGRSGHRLDHRAQPGRAAEAVQAPGDEFPKQARAALGPVILDHQSAVALDQVDLLLPAEIRNIEAFRQQPDRLPDQPEIA